MREGKVMENERRRQEETKTENCALGRKAEGMYHSGIGFHGAVA